MTPVLIGYLICRSKTPWQACFWTFIGGACAFGMVESPLIAFSLKGVLLLATVQALTLIPVAICLRYCYLKNLSMIWALPLFWTGAEYLRILGPTGFPFGALAHPFHETLWLIQIADIGGMHLVSFLIATVSAAILDLRLNGVQDFSLKNLSRLQWNRRNLWLLSVVGLWGIAILYGQFKLSQIQKELRPGPVITVVQPDNPFMDLGDPGDDPLVTLQTLQKLSESGLKQKVDLILWPEAQSTFPEYNPEYLNATPEQLGIQRDSQRYEFWLDERALGEYFSTSIQEWIHKIQTPLLMGKLAIIPGQDQDHDHEYSGLKYYNTAQFIHPDLAEPEQASRQYKVKLFPVGEYNPIRGLRYLNELSQRVGIVNWVSTGNHFSPGSERKVFRVTTATDEIPDPNAEFRFGVSICSEILFPEYSGVFEKQSNGEKQFHFMVNIANEGSFRRNGALLGTEAMMAFRAVEGRMALARSANTGISGFVDPTGKKYGMVTNKQGAKWTGMGMPESGLIRDLMDWRIANEEKILESKKLQEELQKRISKIKSIRSQAGVEGSSTERLRITDRTTFYQRYGDWMGISTLTVLIAFWLQIILRYSLNCLQRKQPGSIVEVAHQADP